MMLSNLRCPSSIVSLVRRNEGWNEVVMWNTRAIICGNAQPVELPYSSQGVICLLREIVRKERKEASDMWSMVFWDLVKEEGRRT